MTANPLVADDFQVLIEGQILFSSNIDLFNSLISVDVEQSLNWPSTVTMVFTGEAALADANVLAPGKACEIKVATTSVFKGEITGLEPEFAEDYSVILTVTAQDKIHKLNHVRGYSTWINSKDSDVASELIGAAGMQADVAATTTVHEFIVQQEETDYQFLLRLAERNGFEVGSEGGKVLFKAPVNGTTINLKWGESLIMFAPRLSAARQVNEVTVRGWDRKRKIAIVGVATATNTSPIKRSGLTSTTQTTAKYLVSDLTLATQGEADALAKSILADINSDYLTAQGKAFGQPNLKPGGMVNITGVGTRFSGEFRVSTVNHRYDSEGWITRFTVDGVRPKLMGDLIFDSAENPHRWGGVYPAIVTNIEDSEGSQARVKLKLPWLGEEDESTWAPVSSVGAGAGRGLMWLPEVNDEVLVAFMQGDLHRPVVLGGLWNGTDSSPVAQADIVDTGVRIRELKTTLGHKITLVDKDKGSVKKGIYIEDSTGTFKLAINVTDKKIEILSDKDFSITTKNSGKTDITSAGAVTLKSDAGVTIEGTSIDIKGSGVVTIKGTSVKIN